MVLLQVRGAQSNPRSQPSLSTSPRRQKLVGAEAGGSGNSERARTEINCSSRRHLETLQPRLVFEQVEESVAAETGGERCKTMQTQALPLRRLGVHYKQRKERAAGRYRPSHHHPAASYAGTDGLHKAREPRDATGRASTRASGLIKLNCRSKRPPRRPKHASISRNQAAPRLNSSRTMASATRLSSDMAEKRQTQLRKLCGFHRPI